MRARVSAVCELYGTGASALVKPYYTWCSCKREIGQTDGAVLIVAGFEVRRPITVWCACGAATKWHPHKPRQDTTTVPVFQPICYTEAVEV